ncbi:MULTISPECIES: mechanosensitive ion channel family protein [unclassified Methanoculleus]|uniref:mechanosensitive ion channel family protein n=1 Tax=unclassified Methanoculleus TaxID=2619537 RepID=UPI0025F5529E|nr:MULTISPECIES: mechanosensitive ion channel family protein [unclassified Methanoculleus]
MEIAEILSSTVPLSDITLERVVLAVLVAIIGWVVVKVLTSVFTKMLSRASNLPALIIEFLVRFFSVLLYVILALVVLATLGFDVSSMVLGLSAVIGLILGFGLQDTITNLAAGVWLAAFRPIDKGEYVEVNGISGTVTSVGIMATELLKLDNTYITIPNSLVWGSPVINSTRMDTRRTEVKVGVAYDSDLNTAIRVATDLMAAHEAVLPSPEPAVVVTELADSSVNLALRAWTKTSDFWGVQWDLTRDVARAFKEAGIEIPFPQVDVHLDGMQ